MAAIDALLFLQPSDLTHFMSCQDQFKGVPRIFIDPGLIEQAAGMNVDLEPFEFRPLNVGPHFQARLATEAATRAAAIDQELTQHRHALFGDAVLQGWDQSLMRQFFIRVLLYRYLGELCDRSFAETRVGVFRPLNPQHFYFDSRLTTDAFIGESDRWRVLDDYPEAANWQADAYRRCFHPEQLRELVASAAPQAVVHIPTTYRHIKEYQAQIHQRFARVVDLPAPFWDIPLYRQRIGWAPVTAFKAEGYLDTCIAYRERVRAVLTEHLGPVVPNRGSLAAQVDLLADRSLMQAINYHVLRNSFAGSQPHFVVTDHDTGNNGPIFSVAAKLGSAITVVPHSSYATGAIPHALGVEVVERDGFKTPMRAVWGEPLACRGVTLGPRAARRQRSEVKTVCMLINGMISNGLFYIDFVGMVQFYQALRAVCEEAGVKLILRLKPTAPGLQLIAASLGVDPQELAQWIKPSIEEIANQADLCVSYGQPTTGTISFLDGGCHLLHATRMLWPTDYAFAPAYFSDGTVDCVQPDEALQRVQRWIVDGALFKVDSKQQFDRFEARLHGAGEGLIFALS